MTESEALAVGARAEALMKDEVFLAAIAVVRDGAVQRWQDAKTVEAREAEHAKLVALNAVSAELLALAAQGRAVATMIEQRRAEKERKRS